MAVDDLCDIRIQNRDDPLDTAAHGYMLAGSASMQDITPATVRRTDGDPRFQNIPTSGLRAQADFSAGQGLYVGDDVSSFYVGPADTTMGKQVICPQVGQTPGVGVPPSYLWFEDGGTNAGQFYGVAQSGANWIVRRYPVTGVDVVALGVNFPSGITRFRGQTYFAFGSAQDVMVLNADTGVVSTPVGGFKADKLASYGSMLYGLVASGMTYKLQRWDPENNNLKDVGIFPAGRQKPQAMIAYGGSLYIVMDRSLWSFTSQNGTVGTMVGPLDSWDVGWSYVPTRPQPVAIYQGALVYIGGNQLRSYMPGGQARILYPVPPHLGDSNVWGTPAALLVVADRLYVLQRPVYAAGAQTAKVWVWNGTQMTAAAVLTNPVSGIFDDSIVQMAAGNGGQIMAILGNASTTLSAMQWFYAPYLTGDARRDVPALGGVFGQGEITSAWLDFGQADAFKSLYRFRVSQIRPFAKTAEPTIYLQTDTDATWRQLVLVADGSLQAVQSSATDYDTLPQVNTYAPTSNTYLRFRRLRWRIVMPTGSAAKCTHLVDAVIVEYDAIMPLRNGFRFTVRVSTEAQALDGQRLYADQAAVAAAVGRLMRLRVSPEDNRNDLNLGLPLTLTWEDGNVYYVRANTRTVVREAWRVDAGPSYLVTFDCQQVATVLPGLA